MRPTSDRLRETLFNILADYTLEARVLDACAGTGALGLEALSRGAAHVVFIDQDPRATQLIARNIDHCDARSQSVVICGALPMVGTRQELATAFDLILVDPPYDDSEIGAILSSIAGLLRLNGRLVLERSKRLSTPFVSGVHLARTVTAGDSALDFFQHTET